MAAYIIENNRWKELVTSWLSIYDVFAPFSSGNNLFYQKVTELNIEDAIFGVVRPVQPLKFFVHPFQERVVPEVQDLKKTIVIGPANCDLAGLKILDRVFMEGDYKDPNYEKRRKNTIIVSIDCARPLSVCFCEKVGIKPFVDEGYDLNLTSVGNGFLIEVGSQAGKELLGDKNSFRQAQELDFEKRNELRNNSSLLVKKYNEKFNIQEKIADSFKTIFPAKEWDEIWKNCVQCGSCTNICPSCVCFFLEDISRNDNFSKAKIWDSCLFPGYARMASGVSPRPLLSERYKNRLACKYMYMVENFGMIGCTGCGRCIAGCPGKIDKRKVLSCVFSSKIEDVRYESVKYL
ncbi:MAG: 4Fe-4S dicluster domain-containing protein [Candidatus Omnitrophica bacterium]|nr:4Fe-4S dicluster domain-containing protein [Candidatus Omnitrophota bacterium]